MTDFILTETDRRLLAALQADATLSLRDLAEHCAVSSSTAWRRVQEMETAGLITGRVTLTDPNALGLTVGSVIHVDLASQTAESRRSFESFVETSPNILHCLMLAGTADYMLITRHASVADFERFLTEALLTRPEVASSRSQLVLRQVKNATALPV